MPEIVEIVLKATDNTSEAFKKLNEHLGESNRAGINLAGTFKALGVAAIALGAALTATVAATLVESVKATMDWGEQLEKLTRQFGMSGESASGFAVAAQHVGLNIDEMSFGLNFFTRSLATAQENQKLFSQGLDKQGKALKVGKTEALDPFTKAMDKLGISMFNARGKAKSFDELMPEIMKKFSKLPEGIEASELAMQMFGARGGSKFLEFLRVGGQGMEKWTAEAKKMGLEMSTETVNAVEELSRTFNDIQGYAKGFFVSIGVELLPKLKEFADFVKTRLIPDLQNIGAALRKGIETNKWSDLAGAFNKIFPKDFSETVATLIGRLVDGLKTGNWKSFFDFAGQKISELVDAMGRWANGPEAQNKINDIVKTIGDALARALIFFAQKSLELLKFLGELMGRVIGWFQGPTGQAYMGSMAQAFVDGFVPALSSAVGKVDWGKAVFGNINWGDALESSIKSNPLTLGPQLAAQVGTMLGQKLTDVLGFASGGVVPGPIGQPQLAVVHGGETVLPVGGRGGGMTVYFTYAPAVSLASQQEAQNVLQPFIEKGIIAARSKQIGATR